MEPNTTIDKTNTNNIILTNYNEIASINAEHGVSLVQHRKTGKIYIKKTLTVYNSSIYVSLQCHPVIGTPHIEAIYEENKELTVIEEYISGTPLNELMESHRLTISKINNYLTDLCRILEQLHNRKPPIIHRDIKPTNIIITQYDKAILLDFNAAKWYSPQDNTDTVMLGTQGYAAPEQYGFGCSSPQTDLYAIGILLKELVASLPEPSNIFDVIITKCTQLEPKQRYQSVTELKNTLTGSTTIATDQEKTSAKEKYTLPGYRTRTPYKMVLATFGYLVMLWLSLTVQIGDSTGAKLWWERFISFAMMMCIILGSCNYLQIQKLIPLCNSKYRFLRFIGVILLILLLIFILSFLMVVVEDIFFTRTV